MTQLTNARAWLRTLPGWTEDEQEADVREWCKSHGLKVSIYRASEIDRAAYVRAIRSTEAAVLPRLDIIVSPPKQRQGRPSHEFARLLDQIRSRAAVVVDIWHDARSDDCKSWDIALSAALRRVSSGRKALAKPEAKAMQAKSVERRRENSPIARWAGLKERGHRDYKTALAMWRSREYQNAAAAQLALPEELHSVSMSSLNRLFGRRT